MKLDIKTQRQIQNSVNKCSSIEEVKALPFAKELENDFTELWEYILEQKGKNEKLHDGYINEVWVCSLIAKENNMYPVLLGDIHKYIDVLMLAGVMRMRPRFMWVNDDEAVCLQLGAPRSVDCMVIHERGNEDSIEMVEIKMNAACIGEMDVPFYLEYADGKVPAHDWRLLTSQFRPQFKPFIELLSCISFFGLNGNKSFTNDDFDQDELKNAANMCYCKSILEIGGGHWADTFYMTKKDGSIIKQKPGDLDFDQINVTFVIRRKGPRWFSKDDVYSNHFLADDVKDAGAKVINDNDEVFIDISRSGINAGRRCYLVQSDGSERWFYPGSYDDVVPVNEFRCIRPNLSIDFKIKEQD